MTIKERKDAQLDLLKEVFNDWQIADTEGFAFTATRIIHDNYKLTIFCCILMDEGIVVVKMNNIECSSNIFSDIDYTIDRMVSYCEGLKNMATVLR